MFSFLPYTYINQMNLVLITNILDEQFEMGRRAIFPPSGLILIPTLPSPGYKYVCLE